MGVRGVMSLWVVPSYYWFPSLLSDGVGGLNFSRLSS